MGRTNHTATKTNKTTSAKASMFEALEGRTMYSATPLAEMGYLQDWKLGSTTATTISAANWNNLTQLNYFSLSPTSTGGLPGYVSSSNTSSVTSASGYNATTQIQGIESLIASHNSSAKVFVSVGGETEVAAMTSLIDHPSEYGTFASEMKAFITNTHSAGVDLDWEPTSATKAEIDGFATLITTLQGQGLNVTAAVMGGPLLLVNSNGQAVDTNGNLTNTDVWEYELNKTAVNALSAIEVMAYPANSEADANADMNNWNAYLKGGSADVDGNTINTSLSKLQYGLDDEDDTTNTASVVKDKVTMSVNDGYSGMFLWDMQGTNSSTIISEIAADQPSQPTQPTTGAISGTVKNASGAGIAGVTVYLDSNNDSKLDNGELSTTTNASGAYSFATVPAGATIIRQVLPSGDTQKTPTSNLGIHVTAAAGQTLSNENFVDNTPAAKPTTGSISGTITSTGGTGIAGVEVYLDPANKGSYVSGDQTAITNASGQYTFSSVPAGATIVRQILPSGDTQVTPSSNYGIHVTVAAGTSLSGENFVDKVSANTNANAVTSNAIFSNNAIGLSDEADVDLA